MLKNVISLCLKVITVNFISNRKESVSTIQGVEESESNDEFEESEDESSNYSEESDSSEESSQKSFDSRTHTSRHSLTNKNRRNVSERTTGNSEHSQANVSSSLRRTKASQEGFIPLELLMKLIPQNETGTTKKRRNRLLDDLIDCTFVIRHNHITITLKVHTR
jgi:ribosomal protein S18